MGRFAQARRRSQSKAPSPYNPMEPPELFGGSPEPVVEFSWSEPSWSPLWVEIQSKRNADPWAWLASVEPLPAGFTDETVVQPGPDWMLYRVRFHYEVGDTEWSNEVGYYTQSSP